MANWLRTLDCEASGQAWCEGKKTVQELAKDVAAALRALEPLSVPDCPEVDGLRLELAQSFEEIASDEYELSQEEAADEFNAVLNEGLYPWGDLEVGPRKGVMATKCCWIKIIPLGTFPSEPVK